MPMSIIARPILLILTVMFVGNCASYPQVRTIVRDSYVLEMVSDDKVVTKENITVEDVGEAKEAIAPLQVQKCVGTQLVVKVKERKDKEGNVVERKELPVYEDVYPLLDHYVRRLRVTNNTEHTLRLDRVDVVLIDGAGKDWEGLDKETLEQNIRAKRPCSSTGKLVESLSSLKLLGADTRVRPGRESTFLAVFKTVDKTILGDWALELIDVPVATNEAGQVTRVTSFEFPLIAKHYQTTIQQSKQSLMAPWKETGRSTKEAGGS